MPANQSGTETYLDLRLSSTTKEGTPLRLDLEAELQ